MAECNPVVEEWISKAEADWEWAQMTGAATNPRLRDGVVYHAQQCVEKLLKARLIQLGHTFRKTHDLDALSQSLQQVDASWSWDENELEDLTDAGVLNRYPGFNTSEDELQELMEIAGRLRQALLHRLGSQLVEQTP
jgi:HEPN domain-containing protein